MGVKKTHQQFLDEIISKGIPVQILGTYINSQTPLSCKCNKCGLVWKIRPNSLLRGCGCPKCGIKKRAQSQSKNNSDFIAEMSKINPQIAIQEEYKGARQPIMCKCNVCAHTWKSAPTNLLKGKGCPVCARNIAADKKRRSHSEFLEIIRSFGHNIEPLDQFKGNSETIKMKCNICGYRWTTTASSIVYGRGCPRCAGNGIYNQEEFVQKLKKINPYVEVTGEYQRSAIPVKCKCLRCGHVWESRPNNLLMGKGCPACFHSATSFIEQVIYEVFGLILGKGKVASRNKSAIGKELDIYIPAMKLAIEPGSWKWHKSKVENDRLKRTLCSKHGIRLITIYSDYNDSVPPFDKDCLCVKETLGFENDLQVLQNLIKDLLRLINIDYEISSSQWESIIRTAYDNSRRITTDEFKNKVLNLHNNIVVVGEYTGAWNKIRCKCSTCGYLWSPAANSLLQGHGCPKCANMKNGRNKRKTSEQFGKEVKAINPNVQLVVPYTQQTERVVCRCEKCGYEWSALPSNLLRGFSCPVCNDRVVLEGYNDLLTKRPDLLPLWHTEKNTNISPSKTTCKSNKKVWWICEKGHEWEATIANVCKGTRCPICANRKLLVGYNDLETTDPHIAAEWHPTLNGTISPHDVFRGSIKSVWWRCREGHEWKTSPNSRTSHKSGCPVCSKKKCAK